VGAEKKVRMCDVRGDRCTREGGYVPFLNPLLHRGGVFKNHKKASRGKSGERTSREKTSTQSYRDQGTFNLLKEGGGSVMVLLPDLHPG